MDAPIGGSTVVEGVVPGQCPWPVPASPCVAGNGAAAGPHYNTDVVERGILPPDNEISEDTEMWLDITVEDGAATATATVPFVPRPGTRSVVVHAMATDHHTGAAGARLACLPVVW